MGDLFTRISCFCLLRSRVVPVFLKMYSKVASLVFLLVSLITASSAVQATEISNAPKILDVVDKLNYPEGTNATIVCSVGSGDLSSLIYEWRKDDVVMSAGRGKKVRVSTPLENDQSILRVSNLSQEDAGLYSCLAKNKFGQDKVSTRLNVKVQLKWTQQPRDVELPVGQSVSVPCSADSIPKPTIEWSKLDGNKFGSELRFNSISQHDAGLYECRARNGLEKDLIARIEVKVLGK